jgi:hypothetical protein
MSTESDRAVGSASEVERLRAERDALQAQLHAVQRRGRWGRALRRTAAIVLVVLTCLSFTAATVAVWANRTLLTTDGWVDTVGPLGSDPAVAAALQPRITDAVFTLLPAQELIADALPEDRAFLAAPLSSAVESFVDDEVGAFLATDQFATLWVDANRVAHERALAVLRGDSDIVQIEGDTVTLNLLPVVNGVLGRLEGVASDLIGQNVDLPEISGGELPDQARDRLSAALGVDLPDDIGQIPVYSADELVVAQQALQVFDRTLLLLLIATPLLLVGAIWASTNRRATVLQLAIGSALLLVVVRRVVLRFQDAIVAMPPQPQGRAAAQAVTEQLSVGLFDLTAVLIVAALTISAIALVTGPYGWAVALRSGVSSMSRAIWDAGARVATGGDTGGMTTWVTAHRQALQIGGAVLVIVVLLLANVSWVWFWVLLALLACWEVALWRLPDDARPPPTPTPATVGHDE